METYTFIKSLKKDIYNIRSEIDELRMENLELRLAIAKLQNPDGWDVESVASNDDTAFECSGESDATSDESEPDVTSECSEPDVTSECSEESDDEYASHVNYELSHLFLKLVEKEDDVFKKKAYERAASIIRDFPDDLTCSSQVARVRGIGKSITKLIDEYMDTGTFKKLHT